MSNANETKSALQRLVMWLRRRVCRHAWISEEPIIYLPRRTCIKCEQEQRKLPEFGAKSKGWVNS